MMMMMLTMMIMLTMMMMLTMMLMLTMMVMSLDSIYTYLDQTLLSVNTF